MFLKLKAKHIVNRVRQETDLEDSDFVTDEGFILLFNEVFRAVRGQIYSFIGDESLGLDTVTLVLDSNKEAELPENLFNIHSVVRDGSIFSPVSLLDMMQNNGRHVDPIYCVKGNRLKLHKNSTATEVDLLFYPAPKLVEELEDEVEFFYNEDRWVVLEIASEVLRREETSNNEVIEKLRQLRIDMANQMAGFTRGGNASVTRRRLRRR